MPPSNKKIVPSEKEKKIIAQNKQLKADYRAAFSTVAGQRVLDDLSKRCFVRQSTFKGDCNITIFNEGKRAVFLHIQTMSEKGKPKRRE